MNLKRIGKKALSFFLALLLVVSVFSVALEPRQVYAAEAPEDILVSDGDLVSPADLSASDMDAEVIEAIEPDNPVEEPKEETAEPSATDIEEISVTDVEEPLAESSSDVESATKDPAPTEPTEEQSASDTTSEDISSASETDVSEPASETESNSDIAEELPVPEPKPMVMMLLGATLGASKHYTVQLKTYNGSSNYGSALTSSDYQPVSSAPVVQRVNLPSSGPSRTGYTFKGWSKSTNATSGTKGWVSVTSNTTYYAAYTPNTYVIYFNANGGTCSTSSKGCTYNSSISLPTASRSGYIFNGWSTSSSATSGAKGTYTLKTAGNITLYATWTADPTYVILFRGINGDNSNSVRKEGKYNASVSIPNPGVYPYHGFQEWQDSSGTRLNAASSVTVKGNETYTAVWKTSTLTSASVTYSGITHNNSASGTNTSSNRLEAVKPGTSISGSSVTSNYWGTMTFSFPTGLVYYDVNGNQVDAKKISVRINSVTSSNPSVCSGISNTTVPMASGTSVTSNQFYAIAGNEYGTANLTVNYTVSGYYDSYSGNVGSQSMTKTATYYVKNTRGGPDLPSYTVTYNANGGTGAPAAQTKHTDLDLTLSSGKPTYTGYDFVKWTTAADGTGTTYNPGDTYTANANVTLYAQWTPTVYTINYDANGGTGAPASQTKVHGTAINLQTGKPSRTGYDFKGWNTSAGGTGTDYAPGAPYTTNANATMYAQWDPYTYPVTYDANGGSNAPANQTKVYDVPLTLSGTKPKREGYNFVKWTTAADGTGTTYAPSATYTANAPLTLYAQWEIAKYTVKYDANGGTEAPASQTKTHGIDITLSSQNPVYVGHTFDGWNTKADGSGVSYTGGTIYSQNADLTLYAQWTPYKYKVVYDANGGANAPANQTKLYDIDLTLSSGLPVWTGRTFLGWNTEKDGSGTSYAAGGKYVKNTDLTLYAQWKLHGYIVKFDANGGEGSMEDQSFKYDEAKNLSANIFEKSDADLHIPCNFLGWGLESDSDTPDYSDKQNVKNLTEADGGIVTLYAIWSTIPKSTLIYDANGGTGAPSSVIGIVDSTTKVSSVKPTWKGHTFLGWSKTPDGGEIEYLGSGDEDFIFPDTNTILYAVWEDTIYKLIYHLDGGTGSFPAQEGIYNQKSNINSAKPSKTGYDFIGWKTVTSDTDHVDGTDYDYDPGDAFTYPDADTHVCAVWKLKSWKVEYDANGGQGAPDAGTKFYGIDYKISDVEPTRYGYIFKGWNTASDGKGTDYIANQTYSKNDNLHLYAVWEPIHYKVRYVANKDTYRGAMADSDHDFNVEKNLTKNAYICPGYKFRGWAKTDDASNTDISFTDQQSVLNLTDKNDDIVPIYGVWDIIDYNISYVLNDTTDYPAANDPKNPVKYTVEDDVEFFDAERPGYEFEGWYENPSFEGSPLSGFDAGKTGDITLYAKWSPERYLIDYILFGGENDLDNPYSYTVEDNVFFFNANRPGYRFLGWTLLGVDSVDKLSPSDLEAIEKETVSSSDTINRLPAGSHGDKVLAAHWKMEIYNIIYHLDGGDNNPENPNTYTIADHIVFKDPSKTDYVFDGWYEDPDFTEPMPEIKEGTTGTVNVYAKWKPAEFPITYHTNGGDNDPENPNTYTMDDEFDFRPATRDYYDFNGWFSNSDLEGEPVPGVELGTTGPIELWALWTPVEYTIEYRVGSNVELPVSYTDTYTVEDEVTLIEEAKWEGFIFKGWHEDPALHDDVQTMIPVGSHGDKVYYADWEMIDYKINYHLNGGTNSKFNVDTYTVRDMVLIYAPTREGYEFNGWYADEGLMDKAVQMFGPGETGDKDFYAKWKALEYEIHYTLNGGENDPENPTHYTPDDEFEFKPAKRDGYDFDGWTTPEGEPITGVEEGTIGDIYVEANWTPIIYNIEYELDGGENSPKNPATYTIEDEFGFEPAKKPGYVFDGWTDEEGTPVPGVKMGTTGDIKVYAHWTAEGYPINYFLYGGVNASENPYSYTIEDTVEFAPATRTGYIFLGWYNDASCTDLVTGIPEGSMGEVDVHAKWLAADYRILYVLKGGVNDDRNPDGYTIEDEVHFHPATREAYKFLGWTMRYLSDSDISGSDISASDISETDLTYVDELPVGSTGDVEMTAYWKAIAYPVIYELDGGENDPENPESYTVEDDDIHIKPPVKPGYEFDGWVDENESPTDLIPAGSTGEKHFKAEWTPIEYTIEYDTQGGENDPENPVVYTVEDGTVIIKPATREGYTFEGWLNEATGEIVTELNALEDGNVKLIAQWKANGPAAPKMGDIPSNGNYTFLILALGMLLLAGGAFGTRQLLLKKKKNCLDK